MSYVTKILQPGENLLVVATLHWIVYAQGAALTIAGLIFALWPGLGPEYRLALNIVGGILIATKVMFNDNIKIDAILGGAVNVATATTQTNLTLLGKKVMQWFRRGTKILVGLINDQGNSSVLRKIIKAFDNFRGIDGARGIIRRT